MSPTGVKQFYTEASATVKTVTGGSTSVDRSSLLFERCDYQPKWCNLSCENLGRF